MTVTPVTSRHDDCAKYVSSHPNADDIAKVLAQEILADEHRTITVSAVQQLSMAARALPVIEALPRPDHVHIHNMLHGASLIPPSDPVPRRQRSPSFERYLADATVRAARREYDELMNTKSANAFGIGSFASAAMDTGHGVHILTVMLTGFAICYYAATQWAPQSKIAPVVAGLFGLTFGLGMEITLYLIRDKRKDMSIEYSKRRAQMTAAATSADQQRIDAKHREMEEIAKQMAVATLNAGEKEVALTSDSGVK